MDRTHQLPPAPEYSAGLEFTVNLLLRSMDPVARRLLARRMIQVFQHVERLALEELNGGGAG